MKRRLSGLFVITALVGCVGDSPTVSMPIPEDPQAAVGYVDDLQAAVSIGRAFLQEQRELDAAEIVARLDLDLVQTRVNELESLATRVVSPGFDRTQWANEVSSYEVDEPGDLTGYTDIGETSMGARNWLVIHAVSRATSRAVLQHEIRGTLTKNGTPIPIGH